MKLEIITPLEMLAQAEAVVSLQAEDASGSFGILPGHADFLTSLTISVLSWKCRDGSERHCAVRGGILSVTDGEMVSVATSEAVLSEDLLSLEHDILAAFQASEETNRTEHIEQARLQLSAIRQIMLHLRPNAGKAPP